MYLHGSFVNKKGDIVTVHIVTGGSTTVEMEIGDGASGVWFTDDPVEISTEVNDCFDHLLRYSASIRLLTDHFIGDLFATSCRDVVVNIYRGEDCIFAGYVEPQSYNQPYNEALDELELNCIDALSALQYSYYKNIFTSGVDWEDVKADASYRTFHDIIIEILNGITADLDITGEGAIRLLYDASRAVNSTASANLILQQLQISDLLFLGDSEDDTWTQDVVLEEIFRYLNLHITQVGFTFYLFSWETVKKAANVSWRNLLNGQLASSTYADVTIANAIAENCDTTVSVGEVFNQIQVTCDVNEIENVIESPLDDDALIQLYSNNQLYCTEFSVEGNGSRARETFKAVCLYGDAISVSHRRGNTVITNLDYREGSITSWFIRMKTARGWTFPRYGAESTDLVALCCQNNQNQHTLPLWLSSQRGACIMGWGSIVTSLAHTDNSPVSKVNMEDCLIVSVNGNGDDTNPSPSMNEIKGSIPVAVYHGGEAGAVFSPADENVINYLVVSGKIALNPLMEMSCTYTEGQTANLNSTDAVPSRDNEDGRYYTRLYWTAATPDADPVHADPPSWGLIPFSDKGPQEYEFKYSGIGNNTDQVSKVSVLACMLVIGDKCVVETGINGTPNDFHWETYKERSQCADDDEYYNQCFFIGIDPKIGDKLIGTEFDIQNNISYTLGIDAEGMAIPITKGDHVSGQVTFKILGVVDTYWDEWTRRHPTWFRHTSYSVNSVPLMAHISNIVVKGLEIKAYSNNGMIDNTESNDLVYLSDTEENFYNKKEIDFKITSALTAAECASLGVNNTINMSTPQQAVDGEGVVTIYDANALNVAKPEKIYVDSYYQEYHTPRLQLEQTISDDTDTGVVSLFKHYTHPALNKSFFVLGITRNIMEGSATLTLRELESSAT